MNKRNNSFFRLTIFLLVIFSCISQKGIAWEENNSDAEHQGVIEVLKNYDIFPQGRIGNALYKEKKLLFSIENIILEDILPIESGGIIYKGVDSAGNVKLGYKGEDTFEPVTPSYYRLITKEKKRKLYRITPNGKIQDLLPYSNTASGIVEGGKGQGAFYHIVKGEEFVNEEDGKTYYKYFFKVHYIYPNRVKVQSLPGNFEDVKLRIKLRWIAQYSLSVEFSDGSSQTIQIP